ncbi:MAG: magnesium transporter [Candidatus Krumholzibacteriota bacterium]|nr:magnesium transporter [Candidatus Krumholzibacteriota bacterium]
MENKVEYIISIFEAGEISFLGNALEGVKAPDAAEILSRLPHDIRAALFNTLEPDYASEVLTLTDEGVTRDILEGLEVGEIVPLINRMASDDAADVLNLLPNTLLHEVLRHISREDYRDLSELLKFDEESAGGLMARELLTVKDGIKIADVISLIRKEAENIEHIQNIFVIDGQGVLLGKIPVISLLIADPQSRVDEVMTRDIVTVTADTDQEEVAGIFAKYDLYSLPVLDEKGKLVGRITVDDIIDVIEEEVNEDITMMAGTGDEEFWERSPLRLSRARLPWLLTGLLGGIASAIVMNHFQGSLESILALVFFVPVITAMGGNVGIQSSAIVVRELAVGGTSAVQTSGKLFRELKVSLLNGLVLGAVLLLAVSLWRRDLRLGMLLGMCLFIIIIWATLMGAFVPLMLKKMKIDPALATGPFITTFNDILGILIYLGIATLFLDWLGKGYNPG